MLFNMLAQPEATTVRQRRGWWGGLGERSETLLVGGWGRD